MAKEKTYQIIVSDKAKIMLGTHLRFLAQVNKSAAREQKDKIMGAIQSLSKMPQRYPFFGEEPIPANKYHKMFIEKRYIVLYQVKEDTVYVEYIIDCRQDYGWLIQQ